jgi:hypothetical protein
MPACRLVRGHRGLVNLEVNVLGSLVLVEVAFCFGLWCDELGADSHVLWMLHFCVEVKVGDVQGHVFCSRGGKGAVDMGFHCWNFDGGCGCFSHVVMLMVGQGEAYAVFLFFNWIEGGDNADVTYGSSLRYVVALYWLHGFGSVGSQPVELIGPSCHPLFCLWALEEVPVLEGRAGCLVGYCIGRVVCRKVLLLDDELVHLVATGVIFVRCCGVSAYIMVPLRWWWTSWSSWFNGWDGWG